MNVLPARFDPYQDFTELVLVGCGGTGAHLARNLGRIAYDLKQRGRHVPVIRLVDFDRVEPSNLGRQAFVAGELGQYKAEVVGRRLSYGLGLVVESIPDHFDARRHVGQGSLICGAVDNHQARAEMARAGCCWLDMGNHPEGAAQLVVGSVGEWDQVVYDPKTNIYRSLPHAGLLFPELLEPEPEPGPSAPVTTPGASCAALVASGDQGLLVNDLVAAVAAQYVHRLVNRLPVNTFLTWLDAASITAKSVPLTPANLAQYRDRARH